MTTTSRGLREGHAFVNLYVIGFCSPLLAALCSVLMGLHPRFPFVSLFAVLFVVGVA
jgi:hypothetical protein